MREHRCGNDAFTPDLIRGPDQILDSWFLRNEEGKARHGEPSGSFVSIGLHDIVSSNCSRGCDSVMRNYPFALRLAIEYRSEMCGPGSLSQLTPLRIRLINSVVETPPTSFTNATCPPLAFTISSPTTGLPLQSAPLTRTSGRTS